jgi:hypothetical protein
MQTMPPMSGFAAVEQAMPASSMPWSSAAAGVVSPMQAIPPMPDFAAAEQAMPASSMPWSSAATDVPPPVQVAPSRPDFWQNDTSNLASMMPQPLVIEPITPPSFIPDINRPAQVNMPPTATGAAVPFSAPPQVNMPPMATGMAPFSAQPPESPLAMADSPARTLPTSPAIMAAEEDINASLATLEQYIATQFAEMSKAPSALSAESSSQTAAQILKAMQNDSSSTD